MSEATNYVKPADVISEIHSVYKQAAQQDGAATSTCYLSKAVETFTCAKLSLFSKKGVAPERADFLIKDATEWAIAWCALDDDFTPKVKKFSSEVSEVSNYKAEQATK